MDIVNDLLLWVHLISLGLGGAASFGIPVVASRLPSAAPEMRPMLLQIMKGLSTLGRAGLGLLIVTGPLLVWLGHGGVGGFNVWFWVKMVLVLLLLLGVIYAGLLLRRAAAGGPPSPRSAPIGMINSLLFIGIVLTAVFAFG